MAQVGSRLITKRANWESGMTDLNHLGRNLMNAPHKLMGKVNEMFSASNIYSNNPLYSVLSSSNLTKMTIGNNSWDWQLKTKDAPPLVVIEDVDSSNSTPGKYARSFKIKLNEGWFKEGDILKPSSSDMRCQARITKDTVRSGDGFIYELRIMTNDQHFFIPKKYMEVGSTWNKIYSNYSEAAQKGGSTQHGFPIALTNKGTFLRKEDSITDFASTEVLVAGIPDSNGRIHKTWFYYAEADFWRQWHAELERSLWMARSTDIVYDETTKRKVLSGPGIFEQLEDSHVERFSYLTTDLLDEYLMDIYFSRSNIGQGRTLRAYTGKYGMKIFSQAINELSNKSGWTKNVEIYTSEYESKIHPNALQAGYQYVKYNAPYGNSLLVVHNPLYDDPKISDEMDPITGGRLMSQRFTILDFTSDEGHSSNIKLVEREGHNNFYYLEGTHGPAGPTSKRDIKHPGGFYEMIATKYQGIHIEDISKCGELILTRA